MTEVLIDPSLTTDTAGWQAVLGLVVVAAGVAWLTYRSAVQPCATLPTLGKGTERAQHKALAERTVAAHWTKYLDILHALVNIKTVFSNGDDGLDRGLDHCAGLLRAALPHWHVHRDAARNLAALPPSLDLDRPILYLCAHIDTVDALAADWEDDDPFTCVRDEAYLTGRGVNDCKAGVAFVLWLAHVMGELPPLNVAFLLTFREEGSGSVGIRKSGGQYAKDFATGLLPVGRAGSIVQVLENTVQIKHAGVVEVGAYDRERASIHIQAVGTLPALRSALATLSSDWKPVVIHPVEQEERPEDEASLEVLTQEGGHSCTVANADNLLHGLIMGGEHDGCRLWCGTVDCCTRVEAKIYVGRGGAAVGEEHRLCLNYRGFGTQDGISADIEEFGRVVGVGGGSVKLTHGFEKGLGSDMREWLHVHEPLAPTLRAVFPENVGKRGGSRASMAVRLKWEGNPGRSDVTKIWRGLPDRLRGSNVLPFTCGPGHRSHRDKSGGGFMRKTHGVNEGFHIASGRVALPYFLELVLALAAMPRVEGAADD